MGQGDHRRHGVRRTLRDRFREFVSADSFSRLFELPQEEKDALLAEDVALLQFAFRFLRQVMFGEESIALNAEAAQERLVKVQEKRLIEEREAAKRRALEVEEDPEDNGE